MAIFSTSTLKDKNGKVLLTWEKRNIIPDYSFLKDLKVEPVKHNRLPRKKLVENTITSYILSDVHFGMLAYHNENNHGKNWDLDIAKEKLMDTFLELVDSSPNAEDAILVNLGDFLHSPDDNNRTKMSQHPLDVDGRFSKIYKEAIALWVWMAETLLKKYKRVFFVSVEGNHDPLFSIYLKTYMQGYFRYDVDRVLFGDGDKVQEYLKWNDILFGFTHGHTVKAEKFPEVMVADNMPILSDINFRYTFTGHIHHGVRKDTPLAIYEVVNSFPINDFWAESNGYRKNDVNTLTSITYQKGRGEVQRNTVRAV